MQAIEITALEFEQAFGYRPAKEQGNGGIVFYDDNELVTTDGDGIELCQHGKAYFFDSGKPIQFCRDCEDIGN